MLDVTNGVDVDIEEEDDVKKYIELLTEACKSAGFTFYSKSLVMFRIFSIFARTGGSTPIGVTFLITAKSIDRIHHVFVYTLADVQESKLLIVLVLHIWENRHRIETLEETRRNRSNWC